MASFYGCFYQVAHIEGSPRSDDPAFRLLRFVQSQEGFDKVVDHLRSGCMEGLGNVYFARCGHPVVLAHSEADQCNGEYIARRAREIEAGFIREVEAKDAQFELLKKLRLDDRQEEVSEVLDAADASHNQKGWVKSMKKRANIDRPVHVGEVNPPLPAAEDTSGMENDPYRLPPGVTAETQRLAAVSYAISPEDSMEVLLKVWAVYPDDADMQAKLMLIGKKAEPFSVHVVDVGQWHFPVQQSWCPTVEKRFYENQKIQAMVDERQRDHQACMEHIEEQKRHRELHEQSVRALADRTGVKPDEATAICETQRGADALASAAAISDAANREDAVEELRRRYL